MKEITISCFILLIQIVVGTFTFMVKFFFIAGNGVEKNPFKKNARTKILSNFYNILIWTNIFAFQLGKTSQAMSACRDLPKGRGIPMKSGLL